MNNRVLSRIGEYSLLIKRSFARPTRMSMFYRQLIREIVQLGVSSLFIVFIISFFIGAVITIQLAINLTYPLIPKFSIGFSAREMVILEFSSTLMCLLLAGKVGSSIASELGTMRVTEQIDALEIMGVNSANFLIQPKIIGFMLFIPILGLFSMITGLLGGYFATFITDNLNNMDFVQGLHFRFNPTMIYHSLIKSLVYAFTISSVSSYYGYNVKGGALEVGQASTKAVVNSSILVLFEDLILTSIMLT